MSLLISATNPSTRISNWTQDYWCKSNSLCRRLKKKYLGSLALLWRLSNLFCKQKKIRIWYSLANLKPSKNFSSTIIYVSNMAFSKTDKS